MSKKKLLTQALFKQLDVTYTCGGGQVTTKATVDVEGGGCCQQEICYCPSVEVMAIVEDCPACGNKHSFDIKYI